MTAAPDRQAENVSELAARLGRELANAMPHADPRNARQLWDAASEAFSHRLRERLLDARREGQRSAAINDRLALGGEP